MTKPTMTEQQYKDHTRRMKRLNGEPEFDNEDEFQAWAEKYIKGFGFRRRTHKDIASNESHLWYEHRPKRGAQGQAIILDLFMWDARQGPLKAVCLEVELKNGETPLTPDQKYIMANRDGVLCRNSEEFKAVFLQWFNEI